MWRLKVADGGNDPYMYSTNNFVGRQIWEFDPDYGTPEERAEVEAARENFRKNRFPVKPSSDLLWRMQFARENPCASNLPQIKVQDLEEVTEEVVTTTLRRGLNFYSTMQAHDGHWPGDYGGPMFLLPGLNKDGGGFGVEGAMEKGRKWILDHGGATAITSWGKMWLSVLGAYEWSGNNPLPPEVWLCPYILPIHPGQESYVREKL
ncbi:Cycloartenol Synthase [Vitis vinifera]|uniref:Cycloartenol Synthase n=1 Tax=Vitis vinifera TaxID=29760 RepID=A0A438CIU8_VITVI|nr:Cycloartenol Synthase [Vitis vinifera]